MPYPEDLRDLARFGYLTGWRVGEIVTLAWSDVDRAGQRITLRSEHSKDGQPRVIPFVVTLVEIIERRWRGGRGSVSRDARDWPQDSERISAISDRRGR